MLLYIQWTILYTYLKTGHIMGTPAAGGRAGGMAGAFDMVFAL